MEKDTFARKREKIVKVSLGTDKAVFTAHICSKGRIVIPKEVRDALSIEEGCLLRCKIRKVAGALQKGSNEMRHSVGRRKRKRGVSTQSHTVEETGRLNDLLLSVIDETMKQVFKEVGAKAVYNYLEKNWHLRRKEVVEKPEIFFAGLERMLGSGASPIEKLILKNLSCRLGLIIEERKNYQFSDYIRELRARLQ